MSCWRKSLPILANLTPLCQTMPCHSPWRNSRAGVVREALPTSQVHYTIPPPMEIPNIWSRHSSRYSPSPRFHLVQSSRNSWCNIAGHQGQRATLQVNFWMDTRLGLKLMLSFLPLHMLLKESRPGKPKSQAQEAALTGWFCWDTMLCPLLWPQAWEGPQTGTAVVTY